MKISILLLLLQFVLIAVKICGQDLRAEEVYKQASEAVVVVLVYDDDNAMVAQGSGVVLNPEGIIVTNYHVLSDNTRLIISHNNEIFDNVEIIAADTSKDILILKIEGKKLRYIKVASSKSLQIGQRIYAIGNPMGLENTISEGIISGLRSFDESQRNLIQITASISPGSSGGAIVNDKGELIGISTYTTKQGQNLNFAIPIKDILQLENENYVENKKDGFLDYFAKGNDADKKRDYLTALKYYSLCIQNDPSAVYAYFNRSKVKFKLKDYEGVIKDLNCAIEISPEISGYYFYRGVAKDKLRYYTDAIEDFNVAIDLDSSFAAAFSNRGDVKFKLGDKDGACFDWSKARALDYPSSDISIQELCK